MLERCLREYFLSYYGSWEGWTSWASPLAKNAYRLKKLQNRWAWAGSVVHHYVSDALAAALSGAPRDPAQVIERAHERMKAQWETSQRGQRSAKDETGFWGLLEHEYREPVSKDAWAQLWDDSRKSIQGFLGAKWPERMVVLVAQGGKVLELDTGDFNSGSMFRLEGVDVWSKPDLAFLDPDGSATTVDWKTGTEKPEHRDQLAGYSLFVAEKHGVAPENQRSELHYLTSGKVVEVNVTQERLREFRAGLIASTAQMRALLADTQKNEPKEMGEFLMTQDRAKCSTCAFRRICGRETA